MLKKAMNAVPENSVILFEDIDCMKAGNRRRELNECNQAQVLTKDTAPDQSADRGGVTLSGLLNVLDGFHAPENVIFVMTTNDVDALDPALLRPGRIDYRLFLGEAAESQKLSCIAGFFLTQRRSKPGNSPSRTAERQWRRSKVFYSLWSSKIML